MRIIFMGTPQFALPTFRALLASNHEVIATYSQPPRPAGRGQKETPSPIHQLAHENNIPVFTPTSLKAPEAQEQFRKLNADIAVVVAYGLLLPQAILEAPRLGCINVHPSKLPRWRGAAPIQRTIMAGDMDTAIVIMQMDAGLDTGDMLLIEPYAITEHTDAGMLHDTLAEKAAPLVLRVLAGESNRQKQPETGVTYAPKISKEECAIDWNQPAEKICRQILGLSPQPGAYFDHKGERIKIFAARYSDESRNPVERKTLDPDLRRDGNGALYIPCNPGVLYPTILQRAGKKLMDVAEFLKGFSW